MIDYAQEPATHHPNDLYDVNYKSTHFTRRNSLKSSTTSRSLKSLRLSKNVEFKRPASTESLAMSITAAVAELRPMPEILPFSVDLPAKVKMSPLVKQHSAPTPTTQPINPKKKSASVQKNCPSADHNDDELITNLFKIDCDLNKDLINDFFMNDHYLMFENKTNAQTKKQQSDNNLLYNRKPLTFIEWNEGLCEWHPNNPYPPFKYYIRSMNKFRTKQQNHYEFDEALGFHLPTEKLPRNPVNTNPVKSKYNTKSVNHFTVPANISNRLEKIAARHNTFNNETTEFNSPIIYPFMEANNHLQFNQPFSKKDVQPQQLIGMNKFVDQIHQRQYSANIKMALEIHATFPHNSENTQSTNKIIHLDSHFPEFQNHAETMLYSNATRMLHMRSEELDRVKQNHNQNSLINYQNLKEYQGPQSSIDQSLTTPIPSQQHRQDVINGKQKVMRSHTTDNEPYNRVEKPYNDVEASRIKSYHEAANIFKINKIQNYTPELERKPTFHPNDKHRSSIENIDKFKHSKNDVVNAGCYVGSDASNITTARDNNNNNNNNCSHTNESCRCVTEIKNNEIRMNGQYNDLQSYTNYQLNKQPSMFQSPYVSHPQRKPKTKKLKAQPNVIQINSNNSSTSLSVYNPFLIASSHPPNKITTFDPFFNSNFPSTAPPNLNGKQDATTQQNENGNSDNSKNNATADNQFVTSLPPIISGKRIKLPLGPHRYTQCHRPTKAALYKSDAQNSLFTQYSLYN